MTEPSYAPMSSLAVVSAVLGLTTTSGLLGPECAVLALPGIGCGLAALSAKALITELASSTDNPVRVVFKTDRIVRPT